MFEGTGALECHEWASRMITRLDPRSLVVGYSVPPGGKLTVTWPRPNVVHGKAMEARAFPWVTAEILAGRLAAGKLRSHLFSFPRIAQVYEAAEAKTGFVKAIMTM